MTQEAIELRTTGDSYPGVSVIQDLNKANQTIATDFAGPDDPASLAGPYMTWADTGTLTIKRRNAADSAWVIEGRLFRAHLPIIPLADTPTTDIGQISVETIGTMEWDGVAYAALSALNTDLQWLGTPIGGYITPFEPPPTDDPRYRYVLCTAGETGAAGYNEGVLTGESVTGSAPLIEATAVVDLAGSPFDTETIHLINTEGRFVGAGEVGAFENDTMQRITGELNGGAHAYGNNASGAFTVVSSGANVGTNTVGGSNKFSFDSGDSVGARTSDHTQPRTHRLPHYRRIL